MRVVFTFIILGVVFLSSCGSDLPVEGSSEAVFYVTGEINGEKIDLRAGDQNYFMSPFFKDDSLNIREYGGKLGLFDCIGDVNCPQSVQFLFREIEKENGIRASVDKTVYPRVCDVRGPASYLFQSYKATFISKSMPSGLEHTWYFGDGSSGYDLNPVHYYLNASDSVVTPVLVVNNSSTGCQSSVSFEVDFESFCEVDFSPKYVSSQITFNPFPTINRTELWSYNGGPYQVLDSIGPPSDSITTVCLISTESSTNCISKKCKNVVLDTSLVGCVANFDVVRETVTLKDVRDYSEIVLIWENANGKRYSSELYKQPDNNYLEIIEVNNYKDAPDGSSTKKVTVKFNLRLFGDSETDFVDFTSNKSVIAIAYPEI